MMGWDEYFLEMLEPVARKSKDPSVRTGAIIVGPCQEILATGFNGFPRKVRDLSKRLSDRETRLRFTVHAEANAVANAARVGARLDGSTCYVNWHPCHECAKLLIQAGVVEIVLPYPDDAIREREERWKDSIATAAEMFSEAGVAVRRVIQLSK